MARPTIGPTRGGDTELREETISPRLRMVFVEKPDP
jgi:hypothetical protein